MATKTIKPATHEDDTKITDTTVTLGDISADVLMSLGFEEVDPLKGLDAVYNAGQEGFTKGTNKIGEYQGFKLCVSTADKKPNWKPHPDPVLAAAGKVCRKLHIFRAFNPANGELGKAYFGLWNAGALDAMLKRIQKGQVVVVTYEGQAEKAFKPGQAKPHTFTLRGKNLELKMSDLMDIEADEEAQIPSQDQQAVA